jgi:preprotein translocase subunit SecD
MKDNRAQTLKQLLKKLSAVRATLNDDQRELLDQMVLNAKIQTSGADRDEVEAHGLTYRPTERPKDKLAEADAHGLTFRPTERPKDKNAEADAHGMTPRPTERPKDKNAEADAHALVSKVVVEADERPTYKIKLDSKSDVYRLED